MASEATAEGVDVEREKNRSFELGHISQLEDLGEELRERAGKQWAEADRRRDRQKAEQLKELARELEERAEERREEWEEKYDD
jgi:thymidylate synthase